MKEQRSFFAPPSLSMEEYCRFVSENFQKGDVAKVRRQKEMEERIEKPFRMPSSVARLQKIVER